MLHGLDERIFSIKSEVALCADLKNTFLIFFCF